MNIKLCMALLAAGLLNGCGLFGGNGDSIDKVLPYLSQGSAELGSQEQTIFTMQAIGCGQYLEGNTIGQTVALMEKGATMREGGEPGMAQDDGSIRNYLDCVRNMQTTSQRQQAPTLNIVVPAN